MMDCESSDTSREEALLQVAMRWHAAVPRGDCDWAAFTLWLEQDPAHRLAFEGISLIEVAIAGLRASQISDPDSAGS